MAVLFFKFPPKSKGNCKTANVCGHCQNQGLSAKIAASKLKDGIIHLTIDKLEEAQKNGHSVAREDIVRLWEALIDEAYEKDCGCAQLLRQHVHCDELKNFWAATRVEVSGGERLSRRQKINRKKNEKNEAKKAEAKVMQDDLPPAPLGKHHAEHRRYKKSKARRAMQAAGAVPPVNTTQAPLPGPAPTSTLSNDAFGALQQALPTVAPPAPPAVSSANPVQHVEGLPVTFVATLASHQKTAKK